MKKLLSFVLALCLILGLCACNEPTPLIEENPVPTESTPEVPEEPENYWEKNMPKMDGSTSLIPLEAGIRSALLGISLEEATAQVSHSTTHGSFYNLLDKVVDLVFSVPISEYQAEIADDSGIELEQIPVAKEGFVFVVNANNPVDGLTQEQLRDIYSGKITNWKEVGGNDEEIIAYQRNEDSGSQNYMTKFMGDTPLMDAPSTLRPATMSGLMDVVAVNDYAEQSIGYSVYAYAADMYGNGNEIKFLAIDGVAPSKVTMASGEYPLLSENYAIFRADEAEDSPVRKLCDWMVSDEGQIAIAKAGYVTLRDIGFDYVELEASPAYSGTGSGYLESWDTPTWQCVAGSNDDPISSESLPYNNTATLPLNVTLPDEIPAKREYPELTPYTTGIKYELNCLKDKTLQAEINAFIAEAVKAADGRAEELFNYLDALNTGEFAVYSQASAWSVMEDGYPSATVSVCARNGYIWAVVSQSYLHNAQDGYRKYYKTECRTWDMFTGEELSVEDLFRKDLDIDEFLNSFLREASQTALDSWGTYPQMKAEFARLPETGWAISPDAIYIDMDNPYFAEGIEFSFYFEPCILCTEEFRDMKGLFTDEVTVAYLLYSSPYEPVYTHANGYDVQLLDETVGNTEIRAKVNKSFLKKIDDITYENAAAYFTEQGYPMTAEDIDTMYGWRLNVYGERLAIFYSKGEFDTYIYEEPFSLFWPGSGGYYIYDLQTGKELGWQDMLIEDWDKICDPVCTNDYLTEINLDMDLNDLTGFEYFTVFYHFNRPNPVELRFTNNDENNQTQPKYVRLYLPLSALKLAEELSK